MRASQNILVCVALLLIPACDVEDAAGAVSEQAKKPGTPANTADTAAEPETPSLGATQVAAGNAAACAPSTLGIRVATPDRRGSLREPNAMIAERSATFSPP